MDLPERQIVGKVVDGHQLPIGSGSEAMLCRATETGGAARRLDVSFTLSVRVERNAVLVAEVALLEGFRLPTLRVTEIDRPTTPDTFARFGLALAHHVGATGADATIGSTYTRQR